jgi:hypothetical protein
MGMTVIVGQAPCDLLSNLDTFGLLTGVQHATRRHGDLPRDLCREASKRRFSLSSQEKKPDPPSFLFQRSHPILFITKRKFARSLMEAHSAHISWHDVIAIHDA